MKRVLWSVLLLTAWQAGVWAANSSLSDLRGLKTYETRIPVYSKDRLQLLFYCAEGMQNGRNLTAVGPVLDIIRRDADADTVDTGKNTRIYPLEAPLADVFKFWSRHLFSDGVVVSAKADIDQENQQAAGGDEVFFRAPLLDLNGVGFDADLPKKRIFVRKDVRIILRTSGSDPLKIVRTGKMPEKYEFLRGRSDTLLIDMEKRIITLAGHVRVSEERGVIDCDRMRILLFGAGRKKAAETDDELSIKGVAYIICDGNVRIRRTGGTEIQQASADRMDYDVVNGRLRLTGPMQQPPSMIQGKNSLRAQVIEIYREQEKIIAMQNCRLVYLQTQDKGSAPTVATADRMTFSNRDNQGEMCGRVQIADPRFTLNCGRMTFALQENGPADEKQKKIASEITGMPEFAPGGKKELRNIHCYEQVRMVRQEPTGGTPEYAEAAEADLQYPAEVVTLSGKSPKLTRGKDSLSGDRLTLHLKKEELVAAPNCRIVVHGAGKDKGAPGGRSVITADRGDLDYGGNLLKFTGNVKVRDPRMALDCREMDIHLRNAPKTAGRRKAGAVPRDEKLLADAQAKKQLDNIVCIGDVRAREPRMRLACDRMTLLFRQVTGRPAPGMLQSQGTELVQVLTDGHVRLENIPDKKAAKTASSGSGPDFNTGKPIWMTADRGKADLVRNVSEFHGHVHAQEEQGTLDCGELYLYARNTASAAGRSAKKRTEDIDADPLAGTEPTQVPQTISIGDTRDLDRVVAKRNVVLVRRLANGGEQQATGQKAEYFVNRRTVELTGEAPDYAQVRDANPQNNGRSRKITVFLDRESVQFDGKVQMEFDRKGGSGGSELPF